MAYSNISKMDEMGVGSGRNRRSRVVCVSRQTWVGLYDCWAEADRHALRGRVGASPTVCESPRDVLAAGLAYAEHALHLASHIDIGLGE